MANKIFTVQGPNGETIKVEAPENATDEQILGFLRTQPSPQEKEVKTSAAKEFAKDTGKLLMTGLAKTSGGLLQNSPAATLLPMVKHWVNKGTEPFNKMSKEVPMPPVTKAAIEGMGGGVLFPAGGVGKSMLAGGLAGTSAESVDQYLQSKPGLEWMRPWLPALAGIVTGGGAGWALGPKQTVAKQDIRRELQGTPEADWRDAADSVRAFGNAGMRTATAAEAFPGDTGLKTLAQGAAGRVGGESLRRTLADRQGDLEDASLRFPRVIGPEVNTEAVAAQAAEAARKRLGQVKAAAQRPLSLISRDEQRGRLPDIPVKDVENIEGLYKGFAGQPGIPRSSADARDALRDIFIDPNADPRLVLGVKKQVDPNNVSGGQILELTEQPGLQQKLSALLLNTAQQTPAQPSARATASATIPKQAINEARQGAFEVINTLPAPWGERAAKAGADYLARKEAWVKPREQGPLRRIAGQSDPAKGPVVESRLNAVMDAPFAGKTAETLRELQKGGGNTRDIATALLQKELSGGTADYATKLAGVSGSPKERQLIELINAVGGDTQMANDLLKSGRNMTMKDPGGISSVIPEMRGLQYLIRPFRTLDMALTGQGEKAIQGELAKLLGAAAATPQGLAELRKIAMFDPNIRKYLSTMSGFIGGRQGAEEN